jgi:hypothetical protein
VTLALFLGISLCAYRLTRLITKDSLFDNQRKAWLKRFPPDTAHARAAGKRASDVSKWGQLIVCAWCIGAWISGLVVAIVSIVGNVPLPILWWFATSTAVGLIARLDA